MLNRALKNADRCARNHPTMSTRLIEFPRRTLVIDCEVLNKARSDADVINGLAAQTG
jgi:RNA12 protein